MTEPVLPKKQAPMPSSPLRKKLRAQGHALKPLVRIGTGGLTDGVVEQIRVALAAHELVKIAVSADAPEERFVVVDRLGEHGIEVVQLLGRMVLAYQATKKKSAGATSHAASKPRRRSWPVGPGERDVSSRPRAPAPPPGAGRERPRTEGRGAPVERPRTGNARGGATFERPRTGGADRGRGTAAERPRGQASPGAGRGPLGRADRERPTGTGRGRSERGRSGGEWDRPGVDRTRAGGDDRFGVAAGRGSGSAGRAPRAGAAAQRSPTSNEGRAGERGWMGERGGRPTGERGRPGAKPSGARTSEPRRTFKRK